MENFIAYNPVAVHFGKDVINDLGEIVSIYGKRVLLVYGKGSIKKNGIYDQVISQLKSIHAEIFEYSGIKSNPIIEDVDRAAEMGRINKIDVIVAVGGGSVLDSAKVISITIPVNASGWDFYEKKIIPTKHVPLITVLTLAASGSEMNGNAVLQNHAVQKKHGLRNTEMFPKHSFLDPQYTFSVSKEYTAYGIVDLIAHVLESYFGKGEATLSDRIGASIIQEALEYGPRLLKNLHDYELRAKIMYAAALALNGLTNNGRLYGEWGVHSLGHHQSVLFDVPHGATLSIAYPAWMKLFSSRIPERISWLGKTLFNVNTPGETIAQFEKFFISLNVPTRLKDLGLNHEQKEKLIALLIKNKANGFHYSLTDEDRKTLVELMDE